jgi:anti-anti-sigma factor
VTAEIYGLQLQTAGETVTARLSGEVDSSNATAVQTRLLDRARGRRLLLDLSALEYFDSSGMAMLKTLSRQTQLELIVAPDSIVARALDIVGLSGTIPISRPRE